MYQTPKACYKKAPVRRETGFESIFRRADQVPNTQEHLDMLSSSNYGPLGDFTINHDLVPGEAKYIKDVCRG
jgi:hypothetical protein